MEFITKLNNLVRVGLSLVDQTYFVTDKTGQLLLKFDTVTEAKKNGVSDLVEYPSDNGGVLTDYKIDRPDTITINGLLNMNIGLADAESFITNNANVLKMVKDNIEALKKSMTECIINMRCGKQGEKGKYFVLKEYDISENANNLNMYEVILSFKQFFNANDLKAKNPASTNTSIIGQAQSFLI
jgi:hypothetical protein